MDPVVEQSPKVEVKEPVKQDLIYVGPTIPGSQLRQYDNYEEGIPQHLGNIFAKWPIIRSLFIPISQLPGHLKELKNSASSLAQIYAQAVRLTQTPVK